MNKWINQNKEIQLDEVDDEKHQQQLHERYIDPLEFKINQATSLRPVRKEINLSQI